MANLSSKNLVIVVEGNIASGKSSLLSFFKSISPVQIVCLHEPIQTWREGVYGGNLLAMFYQDPGKWSFPFQLFVMLTLMEQLVERFMVPTEGKLIVVERSIWS